MYKIEPVDKYKTKRIAGRIVPAIATTTAAIAGLVSKHIPNIVLKGIQDNYNSEVGKRIILSYARINTFIV